MKTLIILAMCLLADSSLQAQEYLREVLSKLESVKSATYDLYSEGWMAGDTLPSSVSKVFVEEYRNPQDTTIGSSFLEWDSEDQTRFELGYDGTVSVYMNRYQKVAEVNDFSNQFLPVRLIQPPFFNYVTSIIRYTLETKDNVTREVKETEKEYYLKLTIDEGVEVEFFGKPFHFPEMSFMADPIMVFEIWIDKETGLPYKYKRELCGSNSGIDECSNVKLNTLPDKNFDLYALVPEGYELVRMGEKNKYDEEPFKLADKPAPDWTAVNMQGDSVSLSSLKGKVMLLNLTGIGCGVCQLAIPFLNELDKRFDKDKFQLVAIDSWGKPLANVRNYISRHQIGYTFLSGNEQVVIDYKTGGFVPFFFLLDENLVIRKVIKGYAKGTTEKKIIDAIEELLK